MKIRILKNIGRERRITERNRTDISLKERLKSGTRSYYHFKSGMFILNHKEIIKRPPHSKHASLSWGGGRFRMKDIVFYDLFINLFNVPSPTAVK